MLRAAQARPNCAGERVYYPERTSRVSIRPARLVNCTTRPLEHGVYRVPRQPGWRTFRTTPDHGQTAATLLLAEAVHILFKRMSASCAGCRLANAKVRPSQDLVWNFPIDAPMTVLHVDGYCVGADINFAGNKAFLVAACGMSTFDVAKPVAKQSAETYAQALMMIMLRFGLAHTVVLDKDSKFHDTFKQSCQLLNINTHTIIRKNHNAIIVERVNEYFDKGIKIFANERGTPAVSRESVLMLVYAWNLAPVPLTNITRSMVVTGHNFSFPVFFWPRKPSG